MNRMLKIINGFYIKKSGMNNIFELKRIFISSIDVAEVKKGVSGFKTLKVECFRILVFNIIEFFKSILKSREPVYKNLDIIFLVFDYITYINFNNGTVVVIEDKCVRKFFFKEVGYFKEHYEAVGFHLDQETVTCKDFFSIKLPRYKNKRNLKNVEEKLLTIIEELESYHQLNEIKFEHNEIYSLSYKVYQIASFYRIENLSLISNYISIAEGLTLKSSRFKKVLCHGDLWSDNILLDEHGNGVLIDFDKTIWFCGIYDLVYYFFMSKFIPSGVLIENIIKDVDKYAESAIKYLNVECKLYLNILKIEEVKICICLFCFLKLTERDFRHNLNGENLNLIRKALRKL